MATIEDYFVEDRSFPPPRALHQGRGLLIDRSLYDEADQGPEAFWARQARELLSGSRTSTPSESGTSPRPVVHRGKLNLAYNCLDRHVEAGHGDRVA